MSTLMVHFHGEIRKNVPDFPSYQELCLTTMVTLPSTAPLSLLSSAMNKKLKKNDSNSDKHSGQNRPQNNINQEIWQLFINSWYKVFCNQPFKQNIHVLSYIFGSSYQSTFHPNNQSWEKFNQQLINLSKYHHAISGHSSAVSSSFLCDSFTQQFLDILTATITN